MSKVTVRSTIKQLRLLADSDSWEERERAGFAARDLLEAEFDNVFPLLEPWVTDRSENIRRAACLSCMQRKKVSDETRIARILQRLETLMADDSLYVRKCCGPFVVGYLGYTYPAITLPWLTRMAASEDFNVKANVAKAFSQALGWRFPKEALVILTLLEEDPHPRVRSAVQSSLRSIRKRLG